MYTNKRCLAVDLGGTKVLIGVVDGRGQILCQRKYPSILASGAQQPEIAGHILDCLKDFLANESAEGVDCLGVGLVGRIDRANGLWLEIEPGRCETVPMADILSRQTGLPCRIDNDVRCALRAERTFGYGQASRDFLYVNIGTGIAAGVVTGGHTVLGASFNSGEVGHVSVDMSGKIPCPCGRTGCAEAIASGSGLDRRARALRSAYPDSRLTFPEDCRCDATEIFRLAREGDALCAKLSVDAAQAAASLIMNLVWVTDPDTVVLGGGIVADAWMYEQICARLHPNAMRFVRGGVHLTELDPGYVGLIGAALCGLQED